MEACWRNAARTIVGVPQRTPTAAVLGDLGWYEYSRRTLFQVVKYLTRLIEMPHDALTRKALVVQQQLVSAAERDGVSSWMVRLKRSLCMWPTGETLWRDIEGYSFRCDKDSDTVCGSDGKEKELQVRLEDGFRDADHAIDVED